MRTVDLVKLPRDGCGRRPAGVIALLVGIALLPAVLVLTAGSAYLRLPGGPWALVAITAVQVVASFAVVASYRRPEIVTAIVAGVSATVVLVADLAPGLVYPVTSATAPWISIAASVAGGAVLACTDAPRRTRLASVFLALGSVIAARPWQGSWTVVAQGLTLFAAPALVGLYIASRRQVVTQLRARVEAARREQHLLADQARAQERARLAEEMHDVVTHRLSLMVLQAGALRVTAADPLTRVAAEELRVAGVQALDELRDLVGVLRGPHDGGLAASPPTPDLAELVDRSVTAGLDVHLDIAGDSASVAPVVARTVYRIVQEALTNISKHAPAANTIVSVRYGPDGVRVRVVNTTPARVAALGRDPELVATGSGQGLVGLARRVELMQGTFRADRDAGERFVLEAQLPAYVPTTS
jgi:signal transduction histidine kinase